MVDGQGGGHGLDAGEGAEGHGSAGARADVDVLEVRGPLVLAGLGLQHHPVLVQLGEHGGDLPLAESVVEGVVQHLGRDAQARGCGPIEGDADLEPGVLLVAGHVPQLGDGREALHEAGHPLAQLLGIGILHRVLVLGAADAVLHREVLHGLKVEANAFHLGQLGLEPVDDFAGAEAAILQGLEVDLDAAAVEGGVGAVDADEGGQAFHGGILQDLSGQRLLPLGHGGEGNRLRGLGDAQKHARVLDREEALGDGEVEQHRGSEGGHGHDQGAGLVLEHPGERPAVEGDDPLEDPLGGLVKAALFFGRGVLQQLGAHHRRERERHHGRHQDGDTEGDGELPEEAAHDIAHEEQRDEHRDQRDRQGQDGEADLLRPLQRRLEGRFTLLDVTHDVLDHHDGIVHHEARRDRQRHEREVVQAVAQQVHHPEGAHQRQRHRHAGDDGGGQGAQEQEDHHHHEADGEHQFELHLLH